MIFAEKTLPTLIIPDERTQPAGIEPTQRKFGLKQNEFLPP